MIVGYALKFRKNVEIIRSMRFNWKGEGMALRKTGESL